ncbi:Amidohydrolase 1 domain protein, partial [mine drainage metagenome]
RYRWSRRGSPNRPGRAPRNGPAREPAVRPSGAPDIGSRKGARSGPRRSRPGRLRSTRRSIRSARSGPWAGNPGREDRVIEAAPPGQQRGHVAPAGRRPVPPARRFRDPAPAATPPTVQIVAGRTWIHGRFETIEVGIDDDGWIRRVAKSLTGAPRRDFGEAVLLPSAVDLHVHFREPGGDPRVESVADGTIEAALGGIGLAADMPNTQPPDRWGWTGWPTAPGGSGAGPRSISCSTRPRPGGIRSPAWAASPAPS